MKLIALLAIALLTATVQAQPVEIKGLRIGDTKESAVSALGDGITLVGQKIPASQISLHFDDTDHLDCVMIKGVSGEDLHKALRKKYGKWNRRCMAGQLFAIDFVVTYLWKIGGVQIFVTEITKTATTGKHGLETVTSIEIATDQYKAQQAPLPISKKERLTDL